jgi:predicted ATPase/DNA-binding winged helix-turn-helix (wHTH) protein
VTLATAALSAAASAGGPQPPSPIRRGSPAVDRMLERSTWSEFPAEKGAFSFGRSHALAFGGFRFVVHSRELTADGVPVPIGSRALEVLAVLIEARGHLVTKDELLSRVWPTTIVEENNLQFQICSLRKALGRGREFIKTAPGRGYRFVGEITVESRAASVETRNDALDSQVAPVVRIEDVRASGNLPAPTSNIIGREAHLSDVGALVDANRLVTLVGAGGIGKTRLAIELASRLSPTFQDGVWIAELASLSDPALVLSTVAAALGLGDGANTAERLGASLGSRRMLLVLDNCEHVISAAAELVEALLHADHRLQVIATSREPLRAEGEWVFRVPPLDVPPDGSDGLDDVLKYSATKLFIERARAADPSSQLDEGVAAAAGLICRRLDGIPLAIELAAARAASLGVEGLAARVNDRLSLLTEGRRTAPPRHQTLRATLDWSYGLLTGPERLLMRRLAVFNGDFTLEAATRVVDVGEGTAPDVVLNLASLVAKSLVAADLSGPVSRYRLQETMRAYAMDKLLGSGELDAIASRHDGAFADLFDRAPFDVDARDTHKAHTYTAKHCAAEG